MKIKAVRTAYTMISLALLVSCLSLNAENAPEAKKTSSFALSPKFAAMTHAFNQRKGAIVPVEFEDDFSELLSLSNKCSKNPEAPMAISKNINFEINNQEIHAGEKTVIPMRENELFDFSIIVKRGKIASLVSAFKSLVTDFPGKFTGTIKQQFVKLLNNFSYRITYKCPLDEKNLEDTVYTTDLMCRHEEVARLLENPSPETAIDIATKNKLSWPDWLDICVNLPELKKS